MDSKKKISNISQYIKGIEENHNEKDYKQTRNISNGNVQRNGDGSSRA